MNGCKDKIKIMRRFKESNRALPLLGQPPLSLLPVTVSLSPTAAKTVKHHTASMMFTFSPDYNIDSRKMSPTPPTVRRERNRRAETMAERICYTSDDACPLIPLTASQLIHLEYSRQTD